MEKAYVDEIITEYLHKIYGFALSKTKNIDIAEELASRITYEVYISLLKADDVHNINGYIYRISSNIHARYLIEENRSNPVLFTEWRSEIAATVDNETHSTNHDESDKNEIHARLRSEISYLSKTQREIVIMHYFDKKKLHEIANRLNLPLSTIGWHLCEARDQIKNGLYDKSETYAKCKDSENNKGSIFSEMKILGKIDTPYMDVSSYFKFCYSHKIAYSAYHKAKTINEIARELSVPAAFIENEIFHLVDNGFMKKISKNKYLTNIYIIKQNKNNEEKIDFILTKYAKKIIDLYIPSIIKTMKQFNMKNFYIPNKDKNFFMWSVITYVCGYNLVVTDIKKELNNFMISRKDGQQNITIATVKDDLQPLPASSYKHGGMITYNKIVPKDMFPLRVWLFFSKFDERQDKYMDYNITLFETLYEFMTGKITKSPTHIDKFISLYEKELIISRQNIDYINMIITSMPEKNFKDSFTHMSEKLISIGKKLDEEIYTIRKKCFPHHMKDLCRVINQNYLASGQLRVYIIDSLLKNNILKPLKNNQKKTVNMIMFSDVITK